MKAIIVGGGIGGLTTALMLRARGIGCEIFEQADTIRELGVGINTLPHAMRELAGLGLLQKLDDVAIRTDQLTASVARAYSIERSTNRVMLNVSLLRKSPDGKTVPVDGVVNATAYNLNGQLKDLQMRRITEGSSIYFIGETGISGNEILVFNIQAAPVGQGEKYSVQFKREFFAD